MKTEAKNHVKVMVVSNGDAHDVRNWSGTPYFASRTIKDRFPNTIIIRHRFIDGVLPKISKLFRKVGWDILREPFVAKFIGFHVERAVIRHQPDIIVSIGATHKLAFADIRTPIIHVSDALFSTITHELDRFSNLWDRSRRLGDAMQARFLKKCSILALSSYWARDDAITAYRLDPNFVKVVPLGSNVEDPGRKDYKEVRDHLQLLFIGTNWKSKGGDKVLNIFSRIHRRVPEARLHIVGCQPDPGLDHESITCHGFLTKSIPSDRERLQELLTRSSFLVVMTTQEAFGLVFCEAAAYGLPAISHRVGGVPTIIEHGVTGLLFSLDDSPDLVADCMERLWLDKLHYWEMSEAARDKYERELNWDAWGLSIEALIAHTLDNPPQHAAARS